MNASRKAKVVLSVFVVLIIGTVGIIFMEKNNGTGEVENVLGKSNISVVPYIVNSPTAVGVVGKEYVYTVECSDGDTSDENLVITLVDAPSWLFVDGKKVYGTPPIGSAGQYKLRIRVSDGEHSSVKESYILIEENETN